MKWFFLLILALITLGVIFFWPKSAVQSDKLQIKIGNTVVLADVAKTAVEREQGLSGRASLGEREGLLFVFDAPSRPGFWMKDMNFPIDIVWISSAKVVVGVERSVAPETYPKGFMPKEPVLYVLELPAGTSQKYHIDTGVSVYFEPNI